ADRSGRRRRGATTCRWECRSRQRQREREQRASCRRFQLEPAAVALGELTREIQAQAAALVRAGVPAAAERLKDGLAIAVGDAVARLVSTPLGSWRMACWI